VHSLLSVHSRFLINLFFSAPPFSSFSSLSLFVEDRNGGSEGLLVLSHQPKPKGKGEDESPNSAEDLSKTYGVDDVLEIQPLHRFVLLSQRVASCGAVEPWSRGAVEPWSRGAGGDLASGP